MTVIVQELFTILIMAFALGMDAFSMGLGLGTAVRRLKQVLEIGLAVGVCHMIMPVIGMAAGHFLSDTLGEVAVYTGGLVLVFIGLQMFISSFNNSERLQFKPAGFGLLMFALSVSVDSLSVGLTLGIFGAHVIMAVLLFGLFAAFMTWAGLLFGRKMTGLLGKYSEALGGSILLFFGLKLVFPM